MQRKEMALAAEKAELVAGHPEGQGDPQGPINPESTRLRAKHNAHNPDA